MPAHQTLAPPERRASTAEAPQTMGERVWQGVGATIQERLGEARQALVDIGHDADVANVVDLASLIHREQFDEADTEAWTTSELTAHNIAQVLLDMPAAARAQAELDGDEYTPEHKHKQDLMIVCQFNQDIGAALTHMPHSMQSDFPDTVHQQATKGLKNHYGLEVLPETALKHIFAGVRREVAFMRSTLDNDIECTPATIEQDLKGADVVVTDEVGQFGIDLKTHNSFEKKITQMLDRKKLTPEEATAARTQGYIDMPIREEDALPTIMANADAIGRIKGYDYEQPEAVIQFIEQLSQHRKDKILQKIGKSAIIS